MRKTPGLLCRQVHLGGRLPRKIECLAGKMARTWCDPFVVSKTYYMQ
jgi:hypothetical protein